MDVGRLDRLRGIVQNRVIDLQMLEVEVVMEEAVILDAVVEVMVVTKTVGVMGKLEPLHHNMVGATDRQVRGPIAMLSLGDLKRIHLMLSSQVIFRFVITWLLYCLFLDPRFLMYLLHLILVLIYLVNYLTCLFVFLLRWVSL